MKFINWVLKLSHEKRYQEDGKTAEQSLIDARNEGKTLRSFNPEQQGDIVMDYYTRRVNGHSTTAREPFTGDL